jgi:hypothetical protein
MGARDFQVWVSPRSGSPLVHSGGNPEAVATDIEMVAGRLKNNWLAIRDDPDAGNQGRDSRALVYDGPTSSFQMLLIPDSSATYTYLSLRFLYARSDGILEPFVDVVSWLMRVYDMYCMPARFMGRAENGSLISGYAIDDVTLLRPALAHSFEFMLDYSGYRTKGGLSPGSSR